MQQLKVLIRAFIQKRMLKNVQHHNSFKHSSNFQVKKFQNSDLAFVQVRIVQRRVVNQVINNKHESEKFGLFDR